MRDADKEDAAPHAALTARGDAAITMGQYLADGTVLDGRYEIQEELGEGGTSITYSAIDLRIGKRVAVKEFLDQSYMARTDSGEVCVLDSSNTGRQEREKSAFLTEAKTLADLSGIQGLVSASDYFEANKTAYIVMEIVPSDLKRYLDRNGVLPAEDVLRGFLALTDTLEAMHRKGVLHRDISPENIGIAARAGVPGSVLSAPFDALTFILMDFGSAGGGADDGEIRIKHGYAAVEQYEKGGLLGPWTDVYGLCACIYRCITGVTPQDALLRQMYDELKRPSELGIHIRKDVEDCVMKGMAVSPDDRYRSMAGLRDAIKSLFSDEEEKKREQRKKRKHRIIAAISALTLLAAGAGGYAWYRAHREDIYFGHERTEVFYLYPEKGTDSKDFFENADEVRKRVELLSNGKYTWEEQRDVIRVVVPHDCLGGGDEASTIAYYITDPWEMYLSYLDNDGMINSINLTERFESVEVIPREDKEPASSEKEEAEEEAAYYFHAKISDSSAEPWKSFYKDGNGIAVFMKDNTNIFASSYEGFANSFQGRLNEDGTIDIKCTASRDNLQKTIMHNMTAAPLKIGMTSVCDTLVNFETAENSRNYGAFQEDDLDSSKTNVLLFFRPFDDTTPAKILSAISDRKALLDILEKPYAIGIPLNDAQKFAVKMHAEDLTGLERELLSGRLYLYWCGGDTTSLPPGSFRMENDGSVLFEFSEESYNSTTGTKVLALPDGTGIHLSCDSCCLASGIKITNGIKFTSFYTEDWENKKILDQHDLDLLNSFGEHSVHYDWASAEKSIYYDEAGEMIKDQRNMRLPNEVTEAGGIRILTAAAEQYGADIIRSSDSVTLAFMDVPEAGYSDNVEDLLRMILRTVPKDGLIKKVYMNFNSGQESEVDVRLTLGGSGSPQAGCRMINVEGTDPDRIKEIIKNSGIFKAEEMEAGDFWTEEIY